MEEKIMDPVTLGVVALMGAVATIGGAAEDLESDIGSQSNPNSQVQLAPQMCRCFCSSYLYCHIPYG